MIKYKMFEGVLQSLDKITVFIVAIFFLILGYRPPWWNKKNNNECLKVDTPQTVTLIPGPPSLPLLGTRWVFYFGGYRFNKIHEYYQDIYRRYGPVVREEALFNIPVINVFERQDIEKVLKASGKYPIRPPTEAVAQYRRSRPDRYASTGIVNEQGEIWHHLRTTLTTDLISPRTISSFAQEVQEIAEDWCALLRDQRDSENLVDNLENLASRLGLETICALVLGRRMGFLLNGGESQTAKELSEAVHEQFIAIRDSYFGLPLWKLFPTSTYAKLTKSEETIYKLALEIIESADEATKESAVFQSVLNANVDPREKTAAIVDFIAAGIHTLKNSFLFLLYAVGAEHNVQNKIIEDHAYSKACMNETFRFMPTANCLARITEQELNLGGHTLKPGSVVICHSSIACRDDKNFKNANKFRPERWLNEEKAETVNAATYLVTPFGAGRRICPGKRFIEHVLPVFLEHTVKNFNIKIDKPLELQFEFLLAPKGPVSMYFEERN